MDVNRSYSILITLYDPSLGSSTSCSVSPLVPPNPTRLPHPLDHRLQLALDHDHLVLPPTGRPFWFVPLKRSRPLDLSTPSTLSASSNLNSHPAALPSPTETRRVWSQHFPTSSPPLAIPTHQLWTPSQALPTSPTRPPVLDFRFGPLSIDWVKYPVPTASDMPSLRPESGTTSLYWGTLHLYREHGATTPPPSSPDSTLTNDDNDDGTTVALVSVPGVLNAAAVLKFIEQPALKENAVEHVRMLRDSTPSRSIVVVKFRRKDRAQEFRRVFNGRPFWDTKDSELCHVVPISSILLKETSLPPYTFPQTPSPSLTNVTTKRDDSKVLSGAAGGKGGRGGRPERPVELPSCPICLERLDTKVTGLVQIQCKHNYHCNCLMRWGDSRCPVCRATNLNPRLTTTGGVEEPSSCAVCTSPSNLWICIICGNVGCGRYQGGHAHSHFTETGHTFSLELGTGRIWSYTDDEYVHRLLRVGGGGGGVAPNSNSTRLIELPSLASTHSYSNHDDISSKIASSLDNGGGGGGGGPDRTAEEEQDKLESIALEYSGLLQSNLEQQREWFEEELSREKERANQWEKRVGELTSDLERERRTTAKADKERRERDGKKDKEVEGFKMRIESMEREVKRSEDERKKERTEANKMRKGLENELEQEKSVTASLTVNLSGLRNEIEQGKRETDLVRGEVEELKDQLNDMMAALTMRDRIEQEPEASELRGGSIGVVAGRGATEGQSPSQVLAGKRKKKSKKK